MVVGTFIKGYTNENIPYYKDKFTNETQYEVPN